MIGAPHAASDATEGVLAYRTNLGQLALYTQTSAGVTDVDEPLDAAEQPPPAERPIRSRSSIPTATSTCSTSTTWPTYPAQPERSGLAFLAPPPRARRVAAVRRDRPLGDDRRRRRPTDCRASSSTASSRRRLSHDQEHDRGVAVGLGHRPPRSVHDHAPGSVTVTAQSRATHHDDDQARHHDHEAGHDDHDEARPRPRRNRSRRPRSRSPRPRSQPDHNGVTTTTKPPTTTTTKPVTTTTLPASSVARRERSDRHPGSRRAFVTTSNVGDLLVYTNTGTDPEFVVGARRHRR